MTADVADLLAPYDRRVREMAMRLRDLIVASVPTAIEQVDPAARIVGYGFGRGYAGLVCAIAPQRSYVNLMFAKGASLPDPEGLLEGTGKRARHVKLRTVEQVDAPGLRALLDAAVSATERSVDDPDGTDVVKR